MTLDCGTDEEQAKYRCKKNIELVAGHRGIRRDTCRGDSGGPLYIQSDEGTYRLLGVTSRGLKDFDHFPPQPCGNGGIYVRADRFLDWIRDVTGISIPGPLS
jgi:endonuclease G